MKGMTCSIYKTDRLGDCTNGGVSSRSNTAIILADDALGIPAIFDAHPGDVVLRIVPGPAARTHWPEQLVAHPVYEDCARNYHWMMGGNFVWSSDSRFPSRQPIAIHDRTEEASMGYVAEGIALRDVEIPADIDPDYEVMVADRPFDLDAIRRAHRPPADDRSPDPPSVGPLARRGQPDSRP